MEKPAALYLKLPEPKKVSMFPKLPKLPKLPEFIIFMSMNSHAMKEPAKDPPKEPSVNCPYFPKNKLKLLRLNDDSEKEPPYPDMKRDRNE